MTLRCRPFGEWAVLVECGDLDTVRRVEAHLLGRRLPWLRELRTAYDTVLVVAEPGAGEALDALAQRLPEEPMAVVCGISPRRIVLDVTYDGPDLAAVAVLTGLAVDGVVGRHTAVDYEVAFLGFTPGFPYLLGLDPALTVPRLADPRTSVPAGSVGIGGDQTGVYPSETPGGWRLIGRTDAVLFDVDRDEPALLRAGDLVRFRAR
jgi:KipI family sensor histidine kinase inhibitor